MRYAPVAESNTVVNPGTVMVKMVNTLVTLPAVLPPHGPDRLASMTHVVHRIVEVIILTPGSRVTNLRLGQKNYHTLCSFRKELPTVLNSKTHETLNETECNK